MNQYKNQFDLKTGSDTELLLKLYVSEKEQCIQNLDGMFGFAVLDQSDKSVVFARDFMGRIPLYYYMIDKKIVIASELKSITHSLGINASEVEIVEQVVITILIMKLVIYKKHNFTVSQMQI